MIDSKFWNGKRVFVTGHTGFKGGWISLWLQKMGASVKGFSLEPPTSPCLFDAARVCDGMESVHGDIRDRAVLEKELVSFKPEIVIHMAAQPLVRYSYDHPVETYMSNVIGTVNLFEAVRNSASVRVVVNITTDKCYDNKEWVWGYRENDPMGGYDPYSNSKGCAELVTSAYRKSFFSPEGSGPDVSVSSVRAGNVIGGGDWAEDRLIPDLINSFLKGESVQIRSPKAIRPWQHALEPLSGYLQLAQKMWVHGDLYAEGWNFGPYPSETYSVAEIADLLTDIWPTEAPKWEDVSDGVHPHEAGYLKLDISKAVLRLGWTPTWTLRQALKSTADWYIAHRDSEDMREVCLRQIDQYIAEAQTK